MSKILIDKTLIEKRIKELRDIAREHNSSCDGHLADELEFFFLKNSVEHSGKIIVSSYTQSGFNKTKHEDILSDEYQTQHKNFDGSLLKVTIKST